jgi:hypothetical protein
MKSYPAFFVLPDSIRQRGTGGVYYQDAGYWSGSEVSIIPEPSTWSLLVGVTAVVPFLYRHKKASAACD